ncbi:hypothetical protein F4774DRAFT_175475 [Daldinia eschscholtzii]|nr:hypothetical protein F4774DRAFT_175475 [Daldinia eschscholtzii]
MSQSSASDGPRLKYTVSHYRKPEHTHEPFVEWMVEEHLPLAMPVFKRHGLLGYSLFVTPAALDEAVKQEVGKARPTWEFAECDCYTEYTPPSPETIKNVTSDPDWHIAVKDEEDWVDITRVECAVGYSTPYLLETSEVVNMSKSKSFSVTRGRHWTRCICYLLPVR